MSQDGQDAKLETVRKLLAKAESCSNFGTPEGDAEAEALTGKASEIIAAYAISEAMLAQEGSGSGKPEARNLVVLAPYAREKTTLFNVVARINRVQVVITERRTGTGQIGITAIGFAGDIEATELLFTSLMVQMTNEVMAQHYQVPRDRHGRVWQGESMYAFRSNFMAGYTARVGERVAAAARSAEQAYQRGAATSVAMVLADRSAQVTKVCQEMFPRVETLRSRRTANPSGQRAGYEAGGRADLGQRRVEAQRRLPG